ncbi:mitochondrial glutathione transporter SLC25A40-like [Tubulanus polymorphus]|uniref:mitochondrial glutathione transporter SLC25A40-like n=1 Tax=Tubulanus polymorphus TaxID=672921 RepID=UPI003DA2B8CD
MGDECCITPAQQMMSSCSGALLTSLFVTPLDVVKIRLQAQQKPFHMGQCFLYCNGLMDHVCACLNGQNGKAWYKVPLPGSTFNGTIDAFVKITRHEGLRSLWSGLPPTLVMAVPATMIYFTAYDQLKVRMGFNESGNKNKVWIPAVAGSMARVFAAAVISPLELIRTKMQSQKLSYMDIGKAVNLALERGGVMSLWSGLVPTVLRDVPFSAIYWSGYELLKGLFLSQKVQQGQKLSLSDFLISGACSGMVAAVLTLPFDVIKTHRQIELGEASLTDKRISKSTVSLMKTIYRQQGITGLFAGTVPRIVKVVPACAIMISSYEYGKIFFSNYNQQSCS